MDGHAVSPFDLSRTLLVGGGLLVPYSLSGSPVIKQEFYANGYSGAWPEWAVSISVLPLTIPPCKMGYSGAIVSGSLGFFRFFPTRVTNT